MVRRGSLRGISFGALIAQQRGYFADLGIDNQETIFASGQEMVQALAAGQLEIGATSNTAAFFNALGRGLRQPFTFDIWHLEHGDASYMVVVRPDLVDQIQQLADLRGRVNGNSAPIRDGGSGFQAKKMLEASGLGLDDVQWVRLGGADMLAAFASKAIDAGWLIEPFVTLGKQRQVLAPWLSLGNYDPGAQVAGIVFSESFIKERNDVARRWGVAYVRGLRDQNDFMKGKLREVVGPALAAHTGLPMELIDRVAWVRPPDGRLNLDSVLEAQAQLLEWGTISQSLRPDQLVDEQFVEHAVQQLGPYRG